MSLPCPSPRAPISPRGPKNQDACRSAPFPRSRIQLPGSAGLANRDTIRRTPSCVLWRVRSKLTDHLSGSRDLRMLPLPLPGHRVPPTSLSEASRSMRVPCRSMQVHRTFSANVAPRALKMTPRRTKSHPKASKMRPRRFKSPSRGPRCLEERQDASRTAPGF